jgi:DNA-binding MarR family transcriptional regulator
VKRPISSVKPSKNAHRVLAAIAAGAETSREIGKRIGIDGRKVTPYTRRLEDQCGFIEKFASVTYARSNQEGHRWRLTPAGRKGLAAADAALRDFPSKT